ncbi:MAG TPA: hypothetical protein VHQ86_03160 [Candidatus Saccharimonadia bacterium]|jgi:hypothetical protein|nr:hypothetical protein [Candidatus Saccharimonadia bacterium]
MKAKLQVSDLNNRIYSHISIAFSAFDDADEERVLKETVKPSTQLPLMTTHDIRQKYGVSDEVATHLVGFQNEIMADFDAAVESLMSRSERYLEVKPFLGDKKFNKGLLEEYVDQNISLKDLNPTNNLYRALGAAAISFVLLALVIWITRIPHLDLGIDPIGGSILGIIWVGLTLLGAASIPKRYRTRKLLVHLAKSKRP